jgi:hypothetical protein
LTIDWAGFDGGTNEIACHWAAKAPKAIWQEPSGAVVCAAVGRPAAASTTAENKTTDTFSMFAFFKDIDTKLR